MFLSWCWHLQVCGLAQFEKASAKHMRGDKCGFVSKPALAPWVLTGPRRAMGLHFPDRAKAATFGGLYQQLCVENSTCHVPIANGKCSNRMCVFCVCVPRGADASSPFVLRSNISNSRLRIVVGHNCSNINCVIQLPHFLLC